MSSQLTKLSGENGREKCRDPDYLFDETTLDSWITFLPRAKVVRAEHASHYVLEDVPELAASAIANATL